MLWSTHAHFDYCCEVWDVLGKTLSNHLQKLQNRAARIIMNFKNESRQSLLTRYSLGWINLEERRAQIKAKLMYKSINNLAPERLTKLFQNSDTIDDYVLKGSSSRLCFPRPKTEFMKGRNISEKLVHYQIKTKAYNLQDVDQTNLPS